MNPLIHHYPTNCLSSPEQWSPLSITTLNNKLFAFTWTMNPLIHHYPTNCLSSPEQWNPLSITTLNNKLSSPEQWTPLSITTRRTVCLHLNNETPYPSLPLTTNCLSSPEQWTPLSNTTRTLNPLIDYSAPAWSPVPGYDSSTWLWLIGLFCHRHCWQCCFEFCSVTCKPKCVTIVIWFLFYFQNKKGTILTWRDPTNLSPKSRLHRWGMKKRSVGTPIYRNWHTLKVLHVISDQLKPGSCNWKFQVWKTLFNINMLGFFYFF